MTLRVGIGGPVGSGKTALMLSLCRSLRDKYNIAAVTNDIYTEEDAQFLVRNEALAPERIIGDETGGRLADAGDAAIGDVERGIAAVDAGLGANYAAVGDFQVHVFSSPQRCS